MYLPDTPSEKRKGRSVNIEVTDSSGNRLAAYTVDELLNVEDAASRVIRAVRKEFKEKRPAYAFGDMQIDGPPKVVETDNPKKVIAAASMHGRRHNMKFKCQSLSNGTVRVKRVA